MIYRQMDQKQPAEFTFTERLFVSGKKHHRVLGHMILLCEPFAKAFVLAVIILLMGAALVGAIALAGYIVNKALQFCITKGYITSSTAAILVCVLFVGTLVLPSAIRFVASLVRENGRQIQQRIASKLERTNDGADI